MEDNKRNKKEFLQGFLFGALIFCILTLVAVFAVFKIRQLTDKENTIKSLIADKYMDEYTEQQLEDGKYAGMINALGDQYSTYVSAAEIEAFSEKSNGTYKGIGIVMVRDDENDIMYVYGVYDNSPASEAGIAADDTVLTVGGRSVSGMTTEEVADLIKGMDDLVTMELKKYETEEVFTVEMVPREIDLITVASEMKDDQTGYIRIAAFKNDTANQFEQAYNSLKEQGMNRLIVDLRGNGGGLFESVIDVLNVFVPKGILVYTEDKKGNRLEYNSECEDPIDVPMAVLVDSSTASAAEIFTGAVKDRECAVIVGENTFGKGIVQGTYMLKDNSAVKLTIKKYYTPNGVNFHGKGIAPDFEEPLGDGNTPTADENDNTYMKAVEVLKEEE